MVELAPTEGLYCPLYLDVPMMISFLAALGDDAAYEENVRRRADSKRTAEGEVSARAGLPSFLSLLPFDLRGKLAGAAESGEFEEYEVVRQHTEASLFNRLRATLLDEGLIKSPDLLNLVKSPPEIGDIVEVKGIIGRNALDELLSAFLRFISFMSPSEDQSKLNVPPTRGASAKNNRKQSGPTVNPAPPEAIETDPAVMRLFRSMRDDLESADMIDVVLQPASGNANVVVTLSKDYGTGRTIDSLLGSQVFALGKVTSVVASGDPVSLLRRSVLGFMPREQQLEMFEGVKDNPMFEHLISAIELEPPVLQILPLAVFV